MATTAENQFEIERRNILFFQYTNMPGGGTLGWNADPNTVENGNTDGETLIYTSPIGTMYQESDGTMWLKTVSPNTWKIMQVDSTASGKTCVDKTITNGNSDTITTSSSGTVRAARFLIHLQGTAGGMGVDELRVAELIAACDGTSLQDHTIYAKLRNGTTISISAAVTYVSNELVLTITNNSGVGNDIKFQSCVDTVP